MELDQESMDIFIAEIAKHIRQTGIITITSARYNVQSWDITRINKKKKEFTLHGLRFGTVPEHTILFKLRVWNILLDDKFAGVILRSFTGKKDKVTKLPVKELRGYRLWLGESDKVCFQQASAEEMDQANTTDARTGKQLEREPGVIYCGQDPDDFILSV